MSGVNTHVSSVCKQYINVLTASRFIYIHTLKEWNIFDRILRFERDMMVLQDLQCKFCQCIYLDWKSQQKNTPVKTVEAPIVKENC